VVEPAHDDAFIEIQHDSLEQARLALYLCRRGAHHLNGLSAHADHALGKFGGGRCNLAERVRLRQGDRRIGARMGDGVDVASQPLQWPNKSRLQQPPRNADGDCKEQPRQNGENDDARGGGAGQLTVFVGRPCAATADKQRDASEYRNDAID